MIYHQKKTIYIDRSENNRNGFVGLLGHGTSLAAPFLFLFFGLVSALQAQINYNTANYNSGSYTYTTIATAYAPSGAGACGFPAANDPSHTAAINSNSGGGGDDYQNGLACGACAALTVTGAAEAITVMIDNACPSCSAADQLDLTQATWQALTGNTNYGQLNIQWKFVPCPLSLMAGDSSGDITYEWKSGCSSGYDPIQFMDSLFPITSVGFSTSNTGPFTALTLGANGVGGNNYWGTTSGNLNGTSGTFYFNVTDGAGGSVVIGPLSVASCGTVNTTNDQVPGPGPTNTPTVTLTPTITLTPTKTNTPGSPTATPQFTFTPTVPASTPLPGGITVQTCPAGNPDPGYSQQQQMVFEGTGLDDMVVGGTCGSALTATLPPGATPVTAFLYIEYDYGSNGAPAVTTGVGFNGSTTPAGTVEGAGVTYGGYANTFYNIRYPISTGLLGGAAGSGGAQKVYPVTPGGSCVGESLVLVYTNPAETSENAVAIGDGNNAWHIEENGEVAYGQAPPDANLNWSCLGLSCSSSSLKLSVAGGRDNCNDGSIDGDQDQVEPYGSGNGPNIGGPPLFTGPTGVLNCGGTNQQGDYDRTYNLGTNFNGGAVSLEWGLSLNEQNAKASFWQQALVSQYQCNPTHQCSVTTSFSGSFIPSGWQVGSVPFGQGGWGIGGGSVSLSSGCNGKNNFLVNNTVPSGPGTLQVSMCSNVNGGNFGGLVFGYNLTTGNGYGLQFFNNGSSNSGTLEWVSYTAGVASTVSTATTPNGALNGCPYWVEVDVNSSCQYSVKLATSQAGLSSASVVATFTGSGCSNGLMGLSADSCENSTFQSFQFTGNCATPTPTNTPTKSPSPTPSRTPTLTPTPSVTSTTTNSATSTTTKTVTATVTATTTSSATASATSSTTSTATSSTTSTTTSTTTRTATMTTTSSATSTTTQTNTTTSTATASPSATKTTTSTGTATSVPTNTTTATAVATATSTSVATSTATAVATATATSVATNTTTSTATAVPTNTATSTMTTTDSQTSTATRTASNTATSTKTATSTVTSTATITPTNTNTDVITPTSTSTPTITNTFTFTDTFTPSNTATNTFTSTDTRTATNTPTVTATATPSNSPTDTFTQTNTRTATDTPTLTATATPTNTRTVTNSPTDTSTVTPTRTPTDTFTSTNTFTDTPTLTATSTPTNTATYTNTRTATNTPTVTDTSTPTDTPTNSFTPTNTPTWTNTRTNTATATPTNSFTATHTATDTDTSTYTYSFTPTWTVTNTATMTDTSTATKTATNTTTNTATSTPTSTYTFTQTYTPTFTWTPTNTYTPTPGVSIVKQASESVAQSGDLVTYSLVLNVVEAPASSVTVTDVLPSTMSFQAGSFGPLPAGGTATNVGNSLSWYFPSLPVGAVTLTYQAVVGNLLQGGTVLTNNAQLTYAGNPVGQKASVNIVVAAVYKVQVAVYNEAGELVKDIWVEELSQEVKTFSLTGATITSLEGKTYVMVGGVIIASWDGTNQGGDPVSNGVYYVQVTSTDPYGVVTNVSQTVTVSRAIAQIQVDIYNEAGEVVKHLYSYADDPGNAPLGQVQLSTGMIAPRVGTPVPGGNNSVTVMFNGTSVVWDGTSDVGAVVTNGDYLIEVHWTDGKGGEEVVSKGVIVERGNSPVTNGNVYAAPNILKGVSSTTVMVNSTTAMTLTVSLYDTAGELVKRPVTGESGTNQVSLDASGLASGLYLAVVDLTDVNGHLIQKQTTKIVVRR